MKKQKDVKREILMPKEAKIYLEIGSDTTLRKFEFIGLRVHRFKGSNRKYFLKVDLDDFIESLIKLY